MGGHKQRHQRPGRGRRKPPRIYVWCGNNDAIEHRQNWDSRKKSYFELSEGIETDEHPFAWSFGYNTKFTNRWAQQVEPGEMLDFNSSRMQRGLRQSGKSVYANVPRWIPENPGSFIWKCPRCNRTYQLSMKILEPYLDKLANAGQTRVSAAHLETIQSKILRAKEDEVTGNNRA